MCPVSPPSVVKANFNLYRKSSAVTDYKEFPERTHFTLGQTGWEEVADYALTWAETDWHDAAKFATR